MIFDGGMSLLRVVVGPAAPAALVPVLLSRSVALGEGVLALATLAAMRFAVAWFSAGSPRFGALVGPVPPLLREAMRRQRVTGVATTGVLRDQGIDDTAGVAAVVLGPVAPSA